jgi:hypothetical protein
LTDTLKKTLAPTYTCAGADTEVGIGGFTEKLNGAGGAKEPASAPLTALVHVTVAGVAGAVIWNVTGATEPDANDNDAGDTVPLLQLTIRVTPPEFACEGVTWIDAD